MRLSKAHNSELWNKTEKQQKQRLLHERDKITRCQWKAAIVYLFFEPMAKPEEKEKNVMSCINSEWMPFNQRHWQSDNTLTAS